MYSYEEPYSSRTAGLARRQRAAGTQRGLCIEHCLVGTGCHLWRLGLYYLALRHTLAARVTTVLYLSPPLTLVWAWLTFYEPLSWEMATGVASLFNGFVIFARAAAPARPIS